jgi:hypothetical protein
MFLFSFFCVSQGPSKKKFNVKSRCVWEIKINQRQRGFRTSNDKRDKYTRKADWKLGNTSQIFPFWQAQGHHDNEEKGTGCNLLLWFSGPCYERVERRHFFLDKKLGLCGYNSCVLEDDQNLRRWFTTHKIKREEIDGYRSCRFFSEKATVKMFPRGRKNDKSSESVNSIRLIHVIYNVLYKTMSAEVTVYRNSIKTWTIRHVWHVLVAKGKKNHFGKSVLTCHDRLQKLTRTSLTVFSKKLTFSPRTTRYKPYKTVTTTPPTQHDTTPMDHSCVLPSSNVSFSESPFRHWTFMSFLWMLPVVAAPSAQGHSCVFPLLFLPATAPSATGHSCPSFECYR